MQQLTRYCAGWVVAASIATSVSYAAIQNLVVTAALGEAVHASSRSQATPLARAVIVPSHQPAPPATPFVRKTPVRPATSGSPAPTLPAAITKVHAVGPTSPPATSPAAPTHGYAMRGGQITLELDTASARLVSAVPAAGYHTETWHTDTWIRVDFVDGDARSSLIVSWFEHPPLVEQSES